MYDKDETVRRAVAEQGFGLDHLVNDESITVLCAVAKHGYGFGFDSLSKHESLILQFVINQFNAKNK